MNRFYNIRIFHNWRLNTLAYRSVNSNPGATNIHFGVKPTFRPHIPAEQTEQYFMFKISVNLYINSTQYAHKAFHETNIHSASQHPQVKWNNKQCSYMHVLFKYYKIIK